MDDEALRRMAEGWWQEPWRTGQPAGPDWRLAFARRVATEAARLERERIEGEVRAESERVPCRCGEAYTGRGLVAPDCARHNECDEMAEMILRRIKGGE